MTTESVAADIWFRLTVSQIWGWSPLGLRDFLYERANVVDGLAGIVLRDRQALTEPKATVRQCSEVPVIDNPVVVDVDVATGPRPMKRGPSAAQRRRKVPCEVGPEHVGHVVQALEDVALSP